MQGACFFAWLKRSRTREAPTPTNISTKSEPLMDRNGTSASPAMARANRVFPVPGDPTSRRPLGMRPPKRENFFGSRRNSMTSWSSALASSIPATSSKVTLFVLSVMSLARLFPKAMAFPPPPCIWRMKNIQTPMRSSMGNQEMSIVMYHGESSAGFAAMRTLAALSLSTIVASLGMKVLKFFPSVSLPVILSPWMVTSRTCPRST